MPKSIYSYSLIILSYRHLNYKYKKILVLFHDKIKLNNKLFKDVKI